MLRDYLDAVQCDIIVFLKECGFSTHFVLHVCVPAFTSLRHSLFTAEKHGERLVYGFVRAAANFCCPICGMKYVFSCHFTPHTIKRALKFCT
jgi:hypothetical protein